MGYVFFLSYFIGFLSLISKKKVFKNYATILLIVVIWVLLGFSETVDLFNYRFMYEEAGRIDIFSFFNDYNGRDKGYTFLMSFFSYLGVDFEEFHAIIATLNILLLIYFSRKITKSTLVVLLLYLTGPFFIDTIQIRTLFVHLMTFIAFFEYANGGKFAFEKSLCIILLASTFHILALFYIPFFLFIKVHNYKIVTFLILGIVLFYPIYVDALAGYLGSWVSMFVYTSGDSNLSVFSRYDLGVSVYKKYGYWLYLNGMLGVLFIIRKYIRESIRSRIDSYKENFCIKYIDMCFVINKYLLLFLPVYAINGAELGRCPRCFFLTFINAVALFMDWNKNEYLKIGIFLASALIVFTEGFMNLFYSMSDAVIMILTNNILVNMF
ncbi:EpsG family protein [Mitsuokella jalaludinii]|uniref:EpsG family protein n=1 Tax=Mitsuokella jalaludinii TaxID=187979 RepID=UPI00241CD940|nr:EpsG family protein [Mitsuokella jalaludinii]